ncbi:MAG TPA: hypothetical protein VFQ83_03460 [Candidatus Udaeobacter sp.]|jgi:hypothetical protein|nr:hypothetical protein [Candidatus Udaeobacter sp.]
MRTKLFFIAGATCAAIVGLQAGTMELQPKESVPPTVTQSEPWQFTIAVPGWVAGMDGTIGVRGVNADIDVSFKDILEHLDMIFTLRAEAQKGPFGIFGEVIYIGLSDHAQINRMINNVDEQVDLTLVDWALSWRILNQPRWSVDFAAGAHYSNVFERLTLNSDPVLIHQTSVRFVDDVAADLRQRLDQDISQSDFIEALRGSIRSVIVSRIGDRLEDLQRHPNIPTGPLGGRIRQEVAQLVERVIEAKLAALRIRIDALRLRGAARRAAVRRAVDAAKAQIANQIAGTLDSKLDRTISRDDYWFDPYVGLRGRFNFNKTYYTAVRGEIGGFGVGADLMWEVEGVFGLNWTRSIFTELGYRALGSNFVDTNFRFDTVMHGPQITTGITF